MISNKKSLEIVLSSVKGFDEPVPKLEQYVTPSDIAADLLWNAFMDRKIEGKNVFDFGCGTGILSFGASALGAKKVTGFDIDVSALKVAKENLEHLKKGKVQIGKIDFIEKDVKDIKIKGDIVIMNPPFGVQTEHADKAFLEKAFETAETVYSLHKAGSDKFLFDLAVKHSFAPIRLGIYGFVIKNTMIFHEKSRYPVKVELWKFLKSDIK